LVFLIIQPLRASAAVGTGVLSVLGFAFLGFFLTAPGTVVSCVASLVLSLSATGFLVIRPLCASVGSSTT